MPTPDRALKLCMLSGRKEQECSSILCMSKAGIGKSLDLCVKSGREMRECAGSVKCSGFKRMYHAILDENQYPGETKEEALELYIKAGRNHDI